MTRLTFTLLLFAITCLARPLAAEGVAPSGAAAGPVLTIRTYPALERDQPDRDTLALASRLMAEAGVTSTWTPCGPSRAGSACSRPLAPNELSVRFVRGPKPTGRDVVSMGTSFIDTARRGGVLATVYVDRISLVARQTSTTTSTMLARAIAHEVAHLLLGTNEHGAQGLMRPLWSLDMVRSDAAKEWVFTPDEGVRLREALEARTR